MSPQALAGLAVAAALVCFVLAILYAAGTIQVLASGGGHHYKHAVAFAVVGVVCLIGANYARQRSSA